MHPYPYQEKRVVFLHRVNDILQLKSLPQTAAWLCFGLTLVLCNMATNGFNILNLQVCQTRCCGGSCMQSLNWGCNLCILCIKCYSLFISSVRRCRCSFKWHWMDLKFFRFCQSWIFPVPSNHVPLLKGLQFTTYSPRVPKLHNELSNPKCFSCGSGLMQYVRTH